MFQWAKTYGQSDSQFSEENVKAVVGADTQMKQTFNQAYQSHTESEDPPVNCAGAHRHSYSKIKHAISQLNIKRKENILLSLDTLKTKVGRREVRLGPQAMRSTRVVQGLRMPCSSSKKN